MYSLAAQNLQQLNTMVRQTPRLVRLSALVLAAVLAVAGSAAAAGRQVTPDKCKRAAHHCGQLALVACCCGDQGDSSTPASPPSNRAQLGGLDLSLQVAPGSPMILPDLDIATAGALRLHSPPHGFCFVELPILFSTFLI